MTLIKPTEEETGQRRCSYFKHWVNEEVDRCVRDGEKKSIEAWLRYPGIGEKSVNFLKSFGVVSSFDVIFENLSTRATNILLRHGVETIDEAKDAILFGKIGKATRNCGSKTLEELRDFLGIENSEQESGGENSDSEKDFMTKDHFEKNLNKKMADFEKKHGHHAQIELHCDGSGLIADLYGNEEYFDNLYEFLR